MQLPKTVTELVSVPEPKEGGPTLIKAGQILRAGGLVAFPTETVYGLGANALDPMAVEKIYLAKGRPSDNPLIVHIADVSQAAPLVSDLPEVAVRLMQCFWPGPLTLVLPKSTRVPDQVSGGLETVAIRMPAHPVALALIKEAGVPVAAPSANLSGRPSPTTAGHVWEDLAGRIDLIIDSGPVGVGVESTVLDVTADFPLILRPGGVTVEALEKVLGFRPGLDPGISTGPEHPAENGIVPRAPGMKYTHYAPKAPLILVDGRLPAVIETIGRLAEEYRRSGQRVGVLAAKETADCYAGNTVITVGSRNKPATIAAGLYAALREFDATPVEIILAEGYERTGLGLAIMNRLAKAAVKVVQAD